MREELMLHAERISAQNVERLIKEKTQSELLLEGRNQAFAIALEKKYEDVFNQFKQEMLKQQSERNIRFNKSYKDFEDTISKNNLNIDK